MLTLTPFSEKPCTNKEKSDINFQCNKSSDNFIITNAQKMTVVMHRILWQKCKQNTFSSLIPPPSMASHWNYTTAPAPYSELALF